MQAKCVLHAGCGPKRLADLPTAFQTGLWTELRLDVDAACEPDVVASITDMGPIGTATTDAVFSSHSIEHLFFHEVAIALAEFRRVLKLDGFALITCPNLQALGKLIAEGRILEPIYQSGMGPISALDILYGHRASVAAGKVYMAHRTGFTQASLQRALSEAGFACSAVGPRGNGLNLWAYATKVAVSEDALKAAVSTYFPP
jgi:hypothetical protein